MTSGPLGQRLPLGAAAAVVALLAEGCGGSGQQVAPATPASTTPHQAGQGQTSAASAATQGQQDATTARQAGTTGPHGAPHRRDRKRPRPQRRQALENLPPDTRVKTAKAAASTAALVSGFTNPVIHVDARATIVEIGIAPDQACRARAGEQRTIAARVRKAVPFVREVRARVGASTLSAYAASHCRQVQLPRGPGSVAYLRSGYQRGTAGPIRIRGPRWSLAYDNSGAFLQILVYKSGRLTSDFVSVTSQGAGIKTFHGSGRLTLKITAAGKWRIQLRDRA